ncbi:MAG: alpha/beta fold hydrolase [Solirubrobacteraceae bacterium]
MTCPDMRGFGWSDVPREGYEKEHLARDVVILLDALDIDQAGVIGHDWGGYAGFLLCLHNPERVTRYLALNTGHPLGRPDPRKALALWRFGYQAVLAVPRLAPRIVGSPRQRLLRATSRRIVDVPPSEFEPFLAQLREPARAWAAGELYRSFVVREAGPLMAGRYARMRLTTPRCSCTAPPTRPSAPRCCAATSSRPTTCASSWWTAWALHRRRAAGDGAAAGTRILRLRIQQPAGAAASRPARFPTQAATLLAILCADANCPSDARAAIVTTSCLPPTWRTPIWRAR